MYNSRNRKFFICDSEKTYLLRTKILCSLVLYNLLLERLVVVASASAMIADCNARLSIW